MDLTIVLSVFGIIVSILVGFGTFYLADKRARRNRWKNAKDMVLQDLSKSLGEGNVPDAAVIQATIRSVLRGHNANDLSAVTLDEVADDLLRQITSDPFLDSERRRQLQREVLDLKAKEEKETTTVEEKKEEAILKRSDRLTWSTLVSLIAGIIASIVASLSFFSIERVLDFLNNTNVTKIVDYTIPVIAALLTVLVSIISLMLSKKAKDEKDRKK